MKDRRNKSGIGHIAERGAFKIWLAIMIIFSYIALDMLNIRTAQDIKRDQARYNLQQIHYCYMRAIEVMTPKMTYETCTNKTKTSFTGDVFILDADTLEFVHETSRDVPRNVPLFFTKESVGKNFRDWESAEKAIHIILQGKDSEKGVDNFWNFDGDAEWLEWKFLPSEFGGLDGKRLIAVQGTQKDEVMKYLSTYRYAHMSVTALLVFLLLVEHGRRRRYDSGRFI